MMRVPNKEPLSQRLHGSFFLAANRISSTHMPT